MKSKINFVGAMVVMLLFTGMVIAGDEHEEEFMNTSRSCMKRNGISEDEFSKLRDDDVDPSELDDKFKCFFHCLLSEMHFLDDAQKLDMAKLEENEYITEEHKNIAKNCKAEHDSVEDPCEYSFMIMSCAMELMDARK
ncbi:general odorant-binding protein 57c [Stomoxys calcitrans]|uniref:Uncharacterized protein n=1 Tax=Stomoxys calcitrans TaxID=35570 RepID=A0A1I8PSV6_STOCA|nr:general odorant-binding protein 57c [Stomoxys calcitrans]